MTRAIARPDVKVTVVGSVAAVSLEASVAVKQNLLPGSPPEIGMSSTILSPGATGGFSRITLSGANAESGRIRMFATFGELSSNATQ